MCGILEGGAFKDDPFGSVVKLALCYTDNKDEGNDKLGFAIRFLHRSAVKV
jgi:hypothetical protein